MTGRLSTRLDRLEREAGAIGGAVSAAAHRTPVHAALEEARRSGEAPATEAERRVLDAYEIACGYLEEGSPWKIPASLREVGRYRAPVFYVALYRDGRMVPGWCEWETLLAFKPRALGELMTRHQRARCCDWLFPVLVDLAEGAVVLDFHGRAPAVDLVPLVPRADARADA